MILPINFPNERIAIAPASINDVIERKNYLDEKDALNIEKLLKRKAKSFITFNTKDEFPFSDRINELKSIEDDWDNYGGYSPSDEIISVVENFLKSLPKKYTALLTEDSIFPNPHGTITVEWRKDNSVVSIEFGLNTSSYYSIINDKTDSDEHLETILSSNKLINAFNKIIA